MNTAMQKRKIERVIKTQGKAFTFRRNSLNKFKEVSKTEVLQIPINGLYHEQASYITITEGLATRRQKKVIPMVMVLYDDFKSQPIKLDDVVTHNSINYKVSGFTNVQEENFAIEISLEVVN